MGDPGGIGAPTFASVSLEGKRQRLELAWGARGLYHVHTNCESTDSLFFMLLVVCSGNEDDPCPCAWFGIRARYINFFRGFSVDIRRVLTGPSGRRLIGVERDDDCMVLLLDVPLWFSTFLSGVSFGVAAADAAGVFGVTLLVSECFLDSPSAPDAGFVIGIFFNDEVVDGSDRSMNAGGA